MGDPGAGAVDGAQPLGVEGVSRYPVGLGGELGVERPLGADGVEVGPHPFGEARQERRTECRRLLVGRPLDDDSELIRLELA